MDTLKNIKNDISIENTKLHFVRIVEIQIFSADTVSTIYPPESEYADIESYSIKQMKNLAKKMSINEEQATFSCFFETRREEKIVSFIKEKKADLIVTATRGKHGIEGLFSSSFTDYLCKFSPCDVLVMRSHKK